jgi:hypothetical protein
MSNLTIPPLGIWVLQASDKWFSAICAKMFLWTKIEQIQIILKTTAKYGPALIHW